MIRGRRCSRAWAVVLAVAVLAAVGCVPPAKKAESAESTNATGATTVDGTGPSSMVEAPSGQGRGLVHSEGTAVIGPGGEPLAMRCVNVDGWLTPTPYLVSDSPAALVTSPSEFMDRLDDVVGSERAERFWDEWRQAFITEADVERMAELGFNCARLVIYSRGIADVDGGEVSLDEDVLTYIDRMVDWGERHGVYIIIDLHAAPGGQNPLSTVADVPSTDPVAALWYGPDAPSNQDATVDLWRQLAERYRDEPWVAGFDLLNEPDLEPGDGDQLIDLYRRIIAAIRSVDPGHMVIVEGDDLAHDVSVFDEPLDDNLLYEFHAYALTPFSEWSSIESTDLDPYLELREEHDRPIWLGEFGEGTQDWIVDMVELMEANDVGWALYPWKRKQTLFWNPVLQRIDDLPEWYDLARYLAQPFGGTEAAPSEEDAEDAMAEVLAAVPLDQNTEDAALAGAITGR